MRPGALAAALFLASCPAAATTFTLDELEIPPEYHGRWHMNPRLCGGPADRGRLEVSAGVLAFGTDRFKVSGVSFLEDGRIGISSDYVGRGKPWGRTDHFLLSRDGETLTAQRAGKTIVRRRCGTAPSAKTAA